MQRDSRALRLDINHMRKVMKLMQTFHLTQKVQVLKRKVTHAMQKGAEQYLLESSLMQKVL